MRAAGESNKPHPRSAAGQSYTHADAVVEDQVRPICAPRSNRDQSNLALAPNGSKQHSSPTVFCSGAKALPSPALTKRGSLGFPATAQLSFSQGSPPLVNQNPSQARAPGVEEAPAIKTPTAQRRQSPMTLRDTAASQDSVKREKKPAPASQERPSSESLINASACMDNSAGAPLPASPSAPGRQLPSSTPFESYATQVARRGIPQATRTDKDSQKAVVRRQALNEYLSSLAPSKTLRPTTASAETLPGVHLDDKSLPSSADWTPVLSNSTVSAEMPVRKHFSSSVIAERPALRNQPSKWLLTGHWPLARKKATMPSEGNRQDSAIQMAVIPYQYVNAEACQPRRHTLPQAPDSQYSPPEEHSSSDHRKWKNIKFLPEKFVTLISGTGNKKPLREISSGDQSYSLHSLDQSFLPASPAPRPAPRLNRPTSERELVMSSKSEWPENPRGSTVSTSSFIASERLHSSEDSTSAKHKSSQYSDSTSVKHKSSLHSTTLSTISRTSISAPTAPHQANIVIADNYRKLRQLVCGEHGLYIVAVCCALALLLVLCILFWPSKTRVELSRRAAPERSDGNCSSFSCLQNLSRPVDLTDWDDGRPCDDFYTFVCSRWTSQLPFPLNSSLSTDDDYVAVLENQIYVSLESERQRSGILQPLKVLHDECMDIAGIEHRGLEALNSLLSDVSLEGFPFTTPVRDNTSVWTIAGQLLRKTGTLALLSVGLAPNPENKSEDIVTVRPPELLSASGLVDMGEVVRLYTAAVFLAIRIFQKEDMPPAEILEVVKFASSIEKRAPSWPRSNFMNIDPLSARPELQEFVKEVFLGAATMPSSDMISDLLVWSSGFTRELVDLVGNTYSHTVLNYIGIRLLIQVSPFLPYSELRDLFSALVYGKPTEPSRWQLCIRVVDKALYPLVHASLFAHVKLKASKASLNRFVRVIVDEFRSEIDNSIYFDASSKSAIRTIISSSVLNTIGPSWPENEASIRDYVEKLPEVRVTQSGLEIYVAYYQHTFLYSLARGSQGRWHRSTFSTDCWYDVQPRTIHVPLLAFNVTQIFDEGAVSVLQASRVGPRLSRCLFDMLLEEANYANGTTKQWLSDDTWKNLLGAEACFEGRQDFLHFARFRDVLAVQVAFNVFEKNASSVEQLVVRLPDDRVISGAQAFFVYLMLQKCEKSGGPRPDGKSSANDEWSTALRNNGRFRSTFGCSRSVVSRPTINCPRYR